MQHNLFEDFLKEWHGQDYHGTDDDMSDAYEAWLESLEQQSLLELGDSAIRKAQSGNIDKQLLRQALYSASPWDLCSDNDNLYRNAVDSVLDSKTLNLNV
jgi:hypothetical protein